ncbi:unnamed protein product, partial [Didymodactylos carnosus]
SSIDDPCYTIARTTYKTAYGLRSNKINQLLLGDSLTKTSERTVKQTIQVSSTAQSGISPSLNSPTSITTPTSVLTTMSTAIHESALMVCYKESLQNLAKFTGEGTKQISQFINNIERIGKMIEAKDEVLYCMCTAKLNGEAQRWYEDNTSLTEWNVLKEALFERFEPTESLSKIFEQLKERKQQSYEIMS